MTTQKLSGVHPNETPFEEKMKVYSEELLKLFEEEKELTGKIKETFNALGFNIERGVKDDKQIS